MARKISTILRHFLFRILLVALPRSKESLMMRGVKFDFVPTKISDDGWCSDLRNCVVKAVELLEEVVDSDLENSIFSSIRRIVFIEKFIPKSHYLKDTVLVPVRDGYTDNFVYLASLIMYYSCMLKQPETKGSRSSCLCFQRKFLSKLPECDEYLKWFDKAVLGKGNI